MARSNILLLPFLLLTGCQTCGGWRECQDCQPAGGCRSQVACDPCSRQPLLPKLNCLDSLRPGCGNDCQSCNTCESGGRSKSCLLSRGQSCESCDEGECMPPKCIDSKFGYCEAKDDFITGHEARQCARKALKSMGGHQFPDDFKAGFIQAYADIADGQSGATPPVPPKKYWNAYYRTAAGHNAAEQWFAGYRAGAQSANSLRPAVYGTVASSGVTYSDGNTRLAVSGYRGPGQDAVLDTSSGPTDVAPYPGATYPGYGTVSPGLPSYPPPSPGAVPPGSPLPYMMPQPAGQAPQTVGPYQSPAVIAPGHSATPGYSTPPAPDGRANVPDVPGMPQRPLQIPLPTRPGDSQPGNVVPGVVPPGPAGVPTVPGSQTGVAPMSWQRSPWSAR